MLQYVRVLAAGVVGLARRRSAKAVRDVDARKIAHADHGMGDRGDAFGLRLRGEKPVVDQRVLRIVLPRVRLGVGDPGVGRRQEEIV